MLLLMLVREISLRAYRYWLRIRSSTFDLIKLRLQKIQFRAKVLLLSLEVDQNVSYVISTSLLIVIRF
jgi:hypothetical protein